MDTLQEEIFNLYADLLVITIIFFYIISKYILRLILIILFLPQYLIPLPRNVTLCFKIATFIIFSARHTYVRFSLFDNEWQRLL